MNVSRAGVLLFVLCAAAGEAQTPPVRPEAAAAVVFVCEHGSVKSLIAREWFNRLASERGLKVRATSRGLSPEASVPGPIADHLRDDGFDVATFHPRPFEPSDLSGAMRIVMIGADPPPFTHGTAARVDRWDGVPPASENYTASRDVLKGRIVKLIDELAQRSPVR